MKLPLRVVSPEDHNFGGAAILDADNRLVADCNILEMKHDGWSQEQCDEHAIRIVTAVNAHEQLRDALAVLVKLWWTDYIDYIDASESGCGESIDKVDDAFTDAEAALALAESKP